MSYLISYLTLQEVEAAVSLLYEAGEGANEEMIKPGCGFLGQLVLGKKHFQFKTHILGYNSIKTFSTELLSFWCRRRQRLHGASAQEKYAQVEDLSCLRRSDAGGCSSL